jgi:hypothetical protein
MPKKVTIDDFINTLESSKKEFIKIAKEMLEAENGKMYPLDIYALGTFKRAILLNTAFCKLLREDNFLSAAPLIRLYLDTLLQFYASFIVKKPHEFAMKIMDGKQARNLKDKNGEKMTDSYLAKKLAKEKDCEWAYTVYDETSKFIHFSSKHIFAGCNYEDGGKFSVCISDKMEVPDKIKMEALDVMAKITKGLLRYLYGWVYTKNNPPK